MRINYGIIGFAVILLPLFIKNVQEDIKKTSTTTIFFVLFLIASSLSTLSSIDLDRSIMRLVLYHAYFIIFVAARSLFPTHKLKLFFAGYYLLAITVLSLISLYNTLILHYLNRAKEGVSFMWIYYGHNHLSALLVFAIPLSLYFLKTYWHQRVLNVVLLLDCYLLIITLFLTFSRASVISLLLAILVAAVLFRIIPKGKMLPLALAILGIAFVFALSVHSAQQLGVAKYGVENPARVVYWKAAIQNGLSHRLGTGLDTFRHISYNTTSKVLHSDSTHNFFLQILSDTGIFGFFASIGLICSALWQGLMKIRQTKNDKEKLFSIALFTGLLASTINSFVDFDWQISTVFLLFWIVAGFFSELKHNN